MQPSLNATPREPAVSGSFYTDNPQELAQEIQYLLKENPSVHKKDVKAIIVPHAGYVYSANTAAKAYATLDKQYKNIFVIGSSHHIDSNGASIYTIGNYKTPLGEIQTNQKIVSELMEKNELFAYHKEAHTKEHTLEVQLPFLQTIYKESLQIVPIIIATQNLQTIKNIADSLRKYFNDDNLFVISTDLSHFPSFDDAAHADSKTLNSITSNDTDTFINTLIENENAGMKEFHTSACGWSSVLTLMYLTQSKNYSYELLDYTNSGNSQYGDKSRVVGYGAISVYKKESFFTTQEKEQLLDIAQLSLDTAIKKNERIAINKDKIYPKLQEKLGAFVTLYKDGTLRGCIGRFDPDEPLHEVIVDMSIASALHDTRFKQVTNDELKQITLELSILTPRKKVDSIDEVIVGKHGIYVQYGSKNGTYLPHVAEQMNWNAKQFVEHCATQKAGISQENLSDIELFVYEAIIIKN